MTVDDLGNLIAKGSLKKLPLALAELTDAERRKFRKQIYKWYREIHMGKESSLPLSPKAAGRRADQAGVLAVLATGTLKEAERVQIWWVLETKEAMEEGIFRVLDDRRPAWTRSWLEKQIEGETFFPWSLLERLIGAGVCEKPESDVYISFLGNRFNDYKQALAPRLKARLEILEEDVWKLFQVSSDAFVLEPKAWHNRFPEAQSWSQALLELTGDGTLDRSRLLDSALDGLARDLNQNILSGILALLKSAKLTTPELTKRQKSLRELLASPVSQVAKFALSGLKKAKPLEVESYLLAAPPVLQLPVKGNSLTLLKHAKKLVEKGQALEDVLPLFEGGLLHAHPDVREFAREWLREQGRETEEEQRLSNEPLELELDLELLSPPWRKLLGFETEGFPEPLEFDIREVPRLSGLEQIEPIGSLQELIDSVAAGVEELPSGLELERILGALCRFCDQRPDDFEFRTEALLKRVTEYQVSESVRGMVSGYAGLSSLLRHLVLLWLKKETPGPYIELEYYRPMNVYPFLKARFEELFQMIAAAQSVPMLSEPTHERGWIEPSILVTRLLEYPGEPPTVDLLQSFLRLAPDGREEALKRARGLKGWWAKPLCWALGGSEEPPRKLKNPEVWLAACRAREPLGALSLPGLSHLPKEALRAIEFRWDTKWVGERYRFPRLSWESARRPELGRLSALKAMVTGNRYREELLPTFQGQLRTTLKNWESVDFQSPWIIDWLALVQPADLRAHWMRATDSLLERLDMDATTTFPNFAWYHPLFDQDGPWGELEHLVVCLGLIGKDADVAGLAVDALIEGLEDGRAHHGPLTTVLKRLYSVDFVKPNRLAMTLGEVARVGSLHQRLVAEVVGEILTLPLPRGGYHLLQLMIEVAQGLSASTRESLRAVTGTGKTAKLAKKLLKLGEPKPLEEWRSAALQGRLERAVRWTEATG